MSAVACPPRAPVQDSLFAARPPVPARPAEPSLAATVAARWGDLRAGSAAACLVCGGSMEPRWSAGHGAVGGRCRSCGTVLD